MTNKDKEYYRSVKNRLGYTSFIKDHKKMSDDYEKFLEAEDIEGGMAWIDGMDHYFIATVNELGIKKEMEIKDLKKEVKRLNKIIKKNK